MTGQPVASDPKAVSTDLHEDEILDEDYAITVPFARPTCQCPEEIRVMEPVGCKDCDLVPGNSDLKLQAFKQAIRQTKMRWTWFSGARALDDGLSRRLGTLGYLPFEIREKIFRLVLDEYIKEAVRYRTWYAPFIQPDLEPLVLRPPAPSWMAMKQQLMDEFETRTRKTHLAHDSKGAKVYQLFCLHQTPCGIPPDIVMPLRLATPDTQSEFDLVFLSTMTFDFSCPKALQLFLDKLSVAQLSQVRYMTIRIHGCNSCSDEYNEATYYKWGVICAKLPSTLISINFDLSGNNGGGCPTSFAWTLGPEKLRLARQGMQFLSGQIGRIALQTEVKLLKKPDPYSRFIYRYFGTSPSTVLNGLEVMVRETETLIANAKARKERERASEDMDIGRNFRVPSFASVADHIKRGV